MTFDIFPKLIIHNYKYSLTNNIKSLQEKIQFLSYKISVYDSYDTKPILSGPRLEFNHSYLGYKEVHGHTSSFFNILLK